MESSTAFDVPLGLKPDTEKRLLRVFVQLRQHDRKTRLAKKTLELNALRDRGAAHEASRMVPPRSSEENHDALAQELLEEEPRESQPLEKLPAAQREVTWQNLERECEELRRGINFKDFDTSGTITSTDISSLLRAMNKIASKAEVQWMVWEIDDTQDGSVDWDEFRAAYARAITDKHGIEPCQLFYLIQFLLSDPDGSASVSVNDVMTELDRVPGAECIKSRVKKALGASNEQDEHVKYSLSEFMQAMLVNLPGTFNAVPNCK